MIKNYSKIIIPSRPQPDTILAIFLLRTFGKEKYPGIEKSKIDILQELPKGETPDSLEEKGVLVLDLGNGKFDHHQKGKNLSRIVAEDLEISDDPALNKLLTYAERDDKYGLGTISSDSIDKALGLSGLIASLNKALSGEPEKIISLIFPLFTAHYIEERKKTEDLPRELEEKTRENKVEIFEIKQDKKKLKVVALESDNLSMAGWLRSAEGLKADVVCQKLSSGYVNILTRPLKKVDLRWVAAFLRNEEAKLRGKKLNYFTFDLMRPGKILEVPEWYYDRATNSILNGGTNPKGIEHTLIPFETLKKILRESLSQEPPERKSQPKPEFSQYFLEIKIPIDKAKEIKNLFPEAPIGIKAHLPENYHITLIYFGCSEEELKTIIEKMKNLLKEIKPFEITIDVKNLRKGKVPGYSLNTFYFEIKSNEGGEILNKIRALAEMGIPDFKKEDFIPHLTIAAALPQVEEKIVREAEIKANSEKRISFLAEKICLTEVFKKFNGETVYRVRNTFYL